MGNASVIIFVISFVLAAFAFTVMWFTARGITRPVHNLCAGSERLGGGDFSHIEPPF